MDKIGNYQILETVYSGPRPLYKVKGPDGKILALKTAAVADLSAEMRARFMREAATCSDLDHPNLIRVYDSGEANGVLFQTMDLLEGSDLNKAMSTRRFTWEEKLSIMEQVCDGLHYAHERHLVHRDIKPANIFLENSGRIRVLDFGMARVDQSTLTQAGSALGTLNYMAPEQVRAEQCNAASDVFAVGIVFYQLATGRHPFTSKNMNLGQILQAILAMDPPPLAEITPDAPEGLDFVLKRALQKDRTHRFQTAGDLKQALALCRVTLKLGATAGSTAGSTLDQGDGRTIAVKRDRAGNIEPVRPVAPPPKPEPPPPPPPPPPPRDIVFCPNCTNPNPRGAAACSRCKLPLGGGAAAGAGGAGDQPWYTRPVALIVGVGLTVFLLVIIWLVQK